ncbi:MAG: hypothetical protein ABI182_02345 [Candidatus Baltobacteraceae bacterium]
MNQPAAFQHAIASSEITRVEVLHAPDQVQTRTALSPADVASYSTSIYDTTDTKKIATLLDAVTQTQMTPTAARPDVRWGIFFRSRTSAVTAALYLDKFGKRGVAQGKNVLLEGGAIVTLLRQQFSPKS